MSGELRRYFGMWARMAQMSLQAQLAYPLGSVGFLVGKLIRLVFFFAFVIAVFEHTDSLAGYTLLQMAVFFLTFNVVDMTAQIFFRGIYGARRVVSDGDFDFYLIQPCSPLFRMAFTTADFLDIATIIPVLVMIGVGIAAAIHVAVAGLAVRTQELENTIWIYRDIMFRGKFPVDIYGGAARSSACSLRPGSFIRSVFASFSLRPPRGFG